MTAYSEFRIRIERGPSRRSYRVYASALGGDAPGTFKVPFSSVDLENFVLKVGRTRRGVRRLESPEWDLAKAFGGRLFTAVMHGHVGELYRSAYSAAEAEGQEGGLFEPVDRNGIRLHQRLERFLEIRSLHWRIQGVGIGRVADDGQDAKRQLDLQRPSWPRQVEVANDGCR